MIGFTKKAANKANQHGSLKALRKKTRNTFNAQLLATLGIIEMEPHEDIEKAISLMTEHIKCLQREFGHVISGKNLIANNVYYENYPEETAAVKKGVHSLLEGSLLVYLFAMWESHTPEDVVDWLTEDEKLILNAFKHVRDSVAHKYNGERATFQNRRHAFEEKMPFSGIIWDQEKDTIDISKSSVALNCHQFMEQLTKHLVIRLHSNAKPQQNA